MELVTGSVLVLAGMLGMMTAVVAMPENNLGLVTFIYKRNVIYSESLTVSDKFL